MRLQPRTIALGAHSWLVRPLTLAQVQAIEPIVASAGETGSVAAAMGVLRIALERDHPQAASSLGDIEATAPEVAQAMAEALRLGGFLPAGEPAPGEAEAGRVAAYDRPVATGAASTPV